VSKAGRYNDWGKLEVCDEWDGERLKEEFLLKNIIC
jgi:hypothetical protein